MFGAALGAIGRGGNSGGYAVNTEGGLKGAMQKIQEAGARKKAVLNSYTNPAPAIPAGPTGLAGGGATSEPEISMSESYNSAASSPVFPPATQERAAAVFGTNDQRQMSTTGFKKEIKERIVQDINSL